MLIGLSRSQFFELSPGVCSSKSASGCCDNKVLITQDSLFSAITYNQALFVSGIQFPLIKRWEIQKDWNLVPCSILLDDSLTWKKKSLNTLNLNFFFYVVGIAESWIHKAHITIYSAPHLTAPCLPFLSLSFHMSSEIILYLMPPLCHRTSSCCSDPAGPLCSRLHLGTGGTRSSVIDYEGLPQSSEHLLCFSTAQTSRTTDKAF